MLEPLDLLEMLHNICMLYNLFVTEQTQLQLALHKEQRK